MASKLQRALTFREIPQLSGNSGPCGICGVGAGGLGSHLGTFAEGVWQVDVGSGLLHVLLKDMLHTRSIIRQTTLVHCV